MAKEGSFIISFPVEKAGAASPTLCLFAWLCVCLCLSSSVVFVLHLMLILSPCPLLLVYLRFSTSVSGRLFVIVYLCMSLSPSTSICVCFRMWLCLSVCLRHCLSAHHLITFPIFTCSAEVQSLFSKRDSGFHFLLLLFPLFLILISLGDAHPSASASSERMLPPCC